MTTLDFILDHKIVAIIRGYDISETIDIVQALYDGGIRIVEVTLNSPNPFKTIAQLSLKFQGQMKIGAGTVMDEEDTRKAIDAGAEFIISPIIDEKSIVFAKKMGAVPMPGAFSPNEIYDAYTKGGEIIKVFPSILGPEYIKNIKGPLPHIPLMPTGGVTAQNIPEYMKAGAIAFGIGGGLLKSNAVGGQRLDDIRNNAHVFTNGIKLALNKEN